ncbi:hypothetical protein KIN20_032503 [Parelaphostrongylus tenuis]|uniref:Uncharacterized protein n=1 Tax=Parelaphostrongylus tenuis TaxID=148309 RepID=A0AAD5R795_PARTN|nr:hypothetical protein KIN20_032503 [Parelaphostrongylus tenuis]
MEEVRWDLESNSATDLLKKMKTKSNETFDALSMSKVLVRLAGQRSPAINRRTPTERHRRGIPPLPNEWMHIIDHNGDYIVD